jgi:hypothetical protein
MAGGYQLDPNNRALDEMETISKIWEPPPDDQLHVFVNLPSVMGSPRVVQLGECFIRLFALAQDS